ncbi:MULTISPECIES: ABC transporter permease [Oerskovia]|uniref:ABC transporter permease n=2 Tax=Oerskovia TaxID=162491 RepID=A0ABR8V4H9_9CELL|nr:MULTISPECIES: ABC transporter permease [Oerskovia]MBD7999682.1 ABC transporter permease [Oerskovia gallyi]MBM7497206.1 putative ABC transport system permease protein [Oerskovia paurometabola]
MSVLGLALSTLRARRKSFVGPFVALFLSAMLVAACGLLMESGIRQGIGPERYAGADLVVTAKQSLAVDVDYDEPFGGRVRLPASAVDELAAIPGVGRAVGDVEVRLGAVGPSGDLAGAVDGRPPVGHGWSSATLGPFVLAQGDGPTAPGQVALDDALAARLAVGVGDDVTLAVGSTPGEYRVTGIVSPPEGTGALRQGVAFFTDEQVADLAAGGPGAPGRPGAADTRGEIDAVGILAADGTDVRALAADVRERTGLTVRTGDARGSVEFADASGSATTLVAIAGSFGGIMLVVVVFVVASALGLVVQQRRRELALLRAVGATPRQVRRMISAEMLVLSTTAAVPGALLGIAAVGVLHGLFVRAGVVSADYPVAVGPLPVVVAVVLTVGVAWLAGRMSARRAITVKPVEALGEAAVQTPRLGVTRTVVGGVLVVGGVFLSMLPAFVAGEDALAGAALSGVVLVIAVALLGPRIVHALVLLVEPFLRRSPHASTYLAGRNTRASSRRLAGAVVPLVLAITMTVVQVSLGAAQVAETERQVADGLRADLVLASSGTGLSPDLAGQVAGVAGVASVTPTVRSQALVRFAESDGTLTAEALTVQGVDPADLAAAIDLDVREGSTDDLHGESVALSVTGASKARAGLGDTVELHLADGTRVDAAVVAIYGRGMGFGDALLPRDLVLPASGDRLDGSLLVVAEEETAVETLAEDLGRATAPYPGVVLADRASLVAAEKAALEANTWTSMILLVVLFGYVALNVANALVMSTVDRRREIALLRLVGTRDRQVLRMMRVEAGVVVGVAVLVATVILLPPLAGVSLGLSEGQRAVPALSPVAYLATVAGAGAVGYLSMLLPTRAALRARPVESIGLRE